MNTRTVDAAGDIRYYNAQGQLHREDGPAVIYPDGRVRWFLNGRRYSFCEWAQRAGLTEEQKTAFRLEYL